MKRGRKTPSHDGEHLFKVLVERMRAHPQYLSADDDLETTGGVIQTAIYFIDRMADDLATAKVKPK